MMEELCDDWVLQLNQGDGVSLGLFLCFQLSKQGIGYWRNEGC